MKNKSTLQQKIKIMRKLFDLGCKTEKDLQSVSMEDMLQIQGITISDMKMIIEIQKQTKANKLFSYLADNFDETR